MRLYVLLLALLQMPLLFIDAQDDAVLSLYVENDNYFVNNEYFNDFQKGYTTPGSWIRPALKWNIDNELTLKAGVYMQHYYGTDTLSAKRMSITAEWDVNENSTITIGDYNAFETYHLPDYLFDSENQFTNPFNQGVVYEWLPGNFEARAWVAWERYINNGDPFREEIFGGVSGKMVLSETDISRFSVPFAWIAYHKGGQIDDSDLPLQNMFNYYMGFLYEIGTCGLYGRYNIFTNDVSATETLYDEGEAFDLGAYYKPKNWEFNLGYWRANKFYSPLGKPIFSSISIVDESLSSEDRSLMKGFVSHSNAITDYAFFRFYAGAFYDTNNSQFDYGAWISLKITPSLIILDPLLKQQKK